MLQAIINGRGSANMADIKGDESRHVVDTLSEDMGALGLEFYSFKVTWCVALQFIIT